MLYNTVYDIIHDIIAVSLAGMSADCRLYLLAHGGLNVCWLVGTLTERTALCC